MNSKHQVWFEDYAMLLARAKNAFGTIGLADAVNSARHDLSQALSILEAADNSLRVPKMSEVVVTYQPELLPSPNEGDEVAVYVQEDSHGDLPDTLKLVWKTGDELPVFGALDARPLADVVNDLRAGAGDWESSEDVWAELQDLRNGE